MKVKFELTLDRNGHPAIEFFNYYNTDGLEQEILKIFIEMAEKNGLELRNPDGFMRGDKPETCYDRYLISVK